ncbi:MAG TPA: hypothetical protein VJ881_01135, partial [Halanaerobiales bacterium]|nr:hypothetical protein [Halanaerobiales bacterium]
MNINQIYEFKNNEESEYIYLLVDGRKIIKRSDQKIDKLNLEKWEIISFIPERFQKIEREATKKEIKEVKKFLNNKSS